MLFGSHNFLFRQLVRRELRQKYQGSVLGLLWYLINPLLLLGCYYVMFGVVLDPGFNHPDYPLFIACAIIVWILVSGAIPAAGDSLIAQGALIRKAIFPRQIIPTAAVVVQILTFLVLVVITLVASALIRPLTIQSLLLLPFALLLLIAFVHGMGLIVSILHVHFRDVLPIVGAILVPWFFLSPIFYEPNDLKNGHPLLSTLLEWANPISPFVTAVRSILFYGQIPALNIWIYMAVAAAISVGLGTLLFKRMSRELAVLV